MTFLPLACSSRAFWLTAMVADGLMRRSASETGAVTGEDMGATFPRIQSGG